MPPFPTRARTIAGTLLLVFFFAACLPNGFRPPAVPPPQTVALSVTLASGLSAEAITSPADPRSGADAMTPLAEPAALTLTATAADSAGGIRRLSILAEYTTEAGTQLRGPFRLSLPGGEARFPPVGAGPTVPSATLTADIDPLPLLGTDDRIVLKLWAEARGEFGQVSRTPFVTVPMELIRLRIAVFAMSDDDGGHPTAVTPGQFQTAVRNLNRRFEGTRLRFVFIPATDWRDLRDSEINRDGPAMRAKANAIADANSGRVAVFLRWGQDTTVTGNGNAYPPPGARPPSPRWTSFDIDQRYIAISSGFGALNAGNGDHFAHEMGHFLGLFHTFPGWDAWLTTGGLDLRTGGLTPAVAPAVATLMQTFAGTRGIRAFDGDGLKDTPPDPNWWAYPVFRGDYCAAPDLTVPGIGTFRPDVTNVMSYFQACPRRPGLKPPPQRFSPDQIEAMHRAFRLPLRSHLRP
ncbi:MAG: hypothetical protein ACKVPY_00350 [Paracoccaceae bacterium]